MSSGGLNSEWEKTILKNLVKNQKISYLDSPIERTLHILYHKISKDNYNINSK